MSFLGQFAAVKRVELRAQVGGTLTKIHFKDGDVVKEGDLLFTVDPTPYEIKLSQANAELKNATARLGLATRELARAETLKQTDAGSAQNVEQRAAEKQSAQAAVEGAEALVRDAKFDLDRCQIRAPFPGRIGTHLVSVGNLVSGSRAANSPTTLLATLVSMDPVYLNFDMSEADYLRFQRERAKNKSPQSDKVDVLLADEKSFERQGTLNFVDNSLERSSGTIRARAIVPNSDMLLTPGGFARVRLSMSTATPALLVPDSSVLPDQSEHVVLTVGADNVVKAKTVKLGDLRGGLRVIRSGLTPTDKVVIDGISAAKPGKKVATKDGAIQYGADRDRSAAQS